MPKGRELRQEPAGETSAAPDRRDSARALGRRIRVEALFALAAFAALCLAVLSLPQQFGVEPDDGAYRASIVGMAEGHLLTLSATEVGNLATRLGDAPGRPPNQWIELPSGRYISEKNPGYPFLAAPFQALGLIRLAPLFYGAFACLGLFIGARRWLGGFGGFAAVGLYCSSGAALLFAWRDYMPTFTDASLIAGASGILLWAVLASEARPGWRTWAGLVAFVAMELAAFVRYTDVLVLACAVVAVIVASRRRSVRLPPRALWWWLASVALFGVGVITFDVLVYGGPLATGYAPGEVTFGLSAIGPNLRYMPAHLMEAMPMLVLGLAALAWIGVRRLSAGRAGGPAAAGPRRDAGIGLALGASWLSIWGLYATYYWTNDPTENTLQAARFYVPALGAISLLGAWLLSRIPGRSWAAAAISVAVVAALFGFGVWSFHAMVAAQLG